LEWNQYFPLYISYMRKVKTSWERKNFPSVKRRRRQGVGRNLSFCLKDRLKDYRLKILATLRQLGWIDGPHTQNFEILKSVEQTQESKKIKSVLKCL
jgi:hypothetical protein